MQSFPEEAITFWNQWQIRLLVLLSLTFQTVLSIFGSRRKFTATFWIRALVWSSYLSADWVATVALGNLARSDSAREDKFLKANGEIQLQAFWAPFLLIHLGGPDTITAYALQDNELWLRHLLSLVVQVGVAIYVYVRFWSTSVLTYLATPIFIVGAFKYGERVFVLYSSTKERLKKFNLLQVIHRKWIGEIRETSRRLLEVCTLIENCARLFTGQVLEYGDRQNDRMILLGEEGIKEKSAEEIFKITAIELGFMYDLLYTKAKMIYSGFGILARCFSLLFSVTALVFFSIFIHSPAHPLADIIITYLLLICTIFTDLYGFILHLFSDWTKFYLSKRRNGSHPDSSTYDATFFSHPLLGNHKRWCRSMGQLNLLSYCIKDKITTPSAAVGKILAINKTLENQWYVTRTDVNDDLAKLIFGELKEKITSNTEPEEQLGSTATGQRTMAGRGYYVLEHRYNKSWLLKCTASRSYDFNLLVWHIATDLCYRDDLHKLCNGNANALHRSCKISKRLSDYMLYLLLVCPSLMPEDNLLETIYMETCRQMEHFSGLLEEPPTVMTPEEMQEWTKKIASAKRPGLWLSYHLQSLQSNQDWNNGRKWEMISEVWVDMLAYAASYGTWNEHGQHLRKGGELLTHVRLLVAHLGLIPEYEYLPQ
ncbi:hypothetical protein KPL70_002514 [Citrus sinensis]|uniref:DUF4220 domain-containing protein n=2 Tax=Citrus sinensis TaxID=2711 RepID=A0A067FFD6_CITSI|nr:uncharacterized protein LOC102619155 [Citrus sinensis]XP_015381650.1 uncharacterized protein LOC102619155 [Citrus sinensis]XP_024950099.1 uncharacterized protein LOC102619155 [Citrus sinensis]XP_052291180.1 uncharacterized protein LOC102619155 [Citrus sinensis]GAY47238.1 hypothetical protein CUMW_103080 [Citrus unshiu]KAH9741144.1 hypothetical protein KPL70_002514 [Citrus sinensis]KAH9789639.1 hypothetical protein KPL71_003103 [Citrus sinensis]KDO64834.1 hypothetical protein CISIN_1g00626